MLESEQRDRGREQQKVIEYIPDPGSGVPPSRSLTNGLESSMQIQTESAPLGHSLRSEHSHPVTQSKCAATVGEWGTCTCNQSPVGHEVAGET